MATNGVPSKQANKQSNPPSQTLYITNLNDKINKEDLRRALYTLFSTHGPVLDVVALKTPKMRGQAHVVYRDIQTSSQAMRALQGFDFLGKDLKIGYARGKSAVVTKLDGTTQLPDTKTGLAPPNAQKSIFNAPSQIPAANTQQGAALKAPNDSAEDGGKSPQGTKRPRDEESGDEAMDEDDEDAAMEESDED